MWCSRCSFTKHYKIGKVVDPTSGERLRLWKCARCGHQQTDPPPFIRSQPHELYFDIETSPNLAFLWSLSVPSKHVNPDMIIRDWYVISWAASWVGEKEVFSGCVTPKDAKNWDDSKILKPLWELLDTADIVIGHNAKRFDIRAVNTRFELHGFGVPRQYKVLDTLTLARRYFKFESNKLEFISKRMGFLPKHEMEFADWVRCTEGDKKTLDKMARYNIGDVKEGKKIYERMKQWVVPFPRRPRDGYKEPVLK